MTYNVVFSEDATQDLEALFDFALQRELVIPFGRSGYVVLFDIVNQSTVLVGAVRHQREDDYH